MRASDIWPLHLHPNHNNLNGYCVTLQDDVGQLQRSFLQQLPVSSTITDDSSSENDQVTVK